MKTITAQIVKEQTVKFAFKNDYDSKIWEFLGVEYNKDVHIDSESERFTYAFLTSRQLNKAFTPDPDMHIEPGYGYIMLKNNKVRQILL